MNSVCSNFINTVCISFFTFKNLSKVDKQWLLVKLLLCHEKVEFGFILERVHGQNVKSQWDAHEKGEEPVW